MSYDWGNNIISQDNIALDVRVGTFTKLCMSKLLIGSFEVTNGHNMMGVRWNFHSLYTGFYTRCYILQADIASCEQKTAKQITFMILQIKPNQSILYFIIIGLAHRHWWRVKLQYLYNGDNYLTIYK